MEQNIIKQDYFEIEWKMQSQTFIYIVSYYFEPYFSTISF